MSELPLVSVIVPNYNHARYLDQRLQSILNQTYRNIEVIILDDCSTDNSLEVIQKYTSDARVVDVIVNEHNSGNTFLQWDKGIHLAKGELIWIAESDDYCSTDFLSRIVALCVDYPDCSIIQSSSCYVNETGDPINKDRHYSMQVVHEQGADAIRKHMICSNFYIPNASAVCFRKEYVKAIPRDYIHYRASGDRLFWIHLLELGNLCSIDIPLNFFRQHNSNKVSSNMEKKGIQCEENHNINKYLHKKKYIRGRVRFVELTYYWDYIHSYKFEREEIRDSLIKLWYPGIKRFRIVYRIRRKIFSLL